MLDTPFYEQISHTAWSVAYRRTFTDISYCDDILALITRDHAAVENARQLVINQPEFTPHFEARYKIGDRLLRASGAAQILEIAAGVAPRGLLWARDPAIIYVEFDLPGMHAQKETIVRELLQREGRTAPNLTLAAGNALDADDLARATAHLDPAQPLAIFHEGLMLYLTFEEKNRLAANILALLRRHGGVWINPDITLNWPYEKWRETTRRLGLAVGRPIEPNLFESEAHAGIFFHEAGFTLERHTMVEVLDELTSTTRLNLDPTMTQNFLSILPVYVLRPKPSA